jgi:hypothetical protein
MNICNNLPGRGHLPITELPCDVSDDIKCHVATIGSILDFVGDRVHGWDKSSSRLTRFGEVRIGLGATMTLSWLLVIEVLANSGGVLRRGTPASEVANCRKENFWSIPDKPTKMLIQRVLIVIMPVPTFSLKNHFQIWLGDPRSINTHPCCLCSNSLHKSRIAKINESFGHSSQVEVQGPI